MMQFLLLFVHILFLETSVSVASQDLFSNDAPIDENPVDGLDLGPMPLEDSGNIAQQASILDYDSNISPNTNLWDLSDKSPVSFETSGDEGNNMDLLASGCLSNDRLGARDGQTSCDNPNKDTIPHIPTFEEMMGAVSALQATQEDKVCFPPRPFHLCCLCGGFTGFGLCEECIICKLAFIHISAAAQSQPSSSDS